MNKINFQREFSDGGGYIALTKEQEMRKALQCLYLQVPESVADDVKKKVLDAYDELKIQPSPLSEDWHEQFTEAEEKIKSLREDKNKLEALYKEAIKQHSLLSEEIFNLVEGRKEFIIAFVIHDNNLKKLKLFVESFGDKYEDHFDFIDHGGDASLKFKTASGATYTLSPGDVIMRNNTGEYYPCKPIPATQ